MRILFIDDERELSTVLSEQYRNSLSLREFSAKELEIISNSVVDIARNSVEAINFLSLNTYDMIFFDHDLGGDDNAKLVANWIVNQGIGPFEYYVHSANPVGRNNIDSYLGQYFSVRFSKERIQW